MADNGMLWVYRASSAGRQRAGVIHQKQDFQYQSISHPIRRLIQAIWREM